MASTNWRQGEQRRPNPLGSVPDSARSAGMSATQSSGVWHVSNGGTQLAAEQIAPHHLHTTVTTSRVHDRTDRQGTCGRKSRNRRRSPPPAFASCVSSFGTYGRPAQLELPAVAGSSLWELCPGGAG